MTRWIAVALLSLGMMAAPARADDSSAERGRVALGYRETEAPVGIRWWFSQHKFGLDLGAGFDTHKDALSGDNRNAWRIDAGLPWALKSWDRVDVILRPGVNYAEQDYTEYQISPTLGFSYEKVTDKIVSGTAEIEAEVFLVQSVSVSASYGIRVVNINPGLSGLKTTTDFGTFASNFTWLGFHVYLWK